MRKLPFFVTGGGVAVIAAIAALAGGVTSAGGATTCTPVKSIEAIIDDSGSMSSTDPNRLRVQGLDLLIDTPGNENIQLGAVEFGSDADTVFAPEAIGPNAGAMKTSLDQKIHADNGGTNYNAAFDKAKQDAPNAEARIFLTDGGHNEGDYNNGHTPGPRTYVIGFGSSTTGEADARLQKIATDTGGKYYRQTDSSKLQAVMNEIGTTLTCQSIPRTFTDTFTKVGQSKRHQVKIGKKSKTAQFALSWVSSGDQFTIGNLVIKRHGKNVAKAKVRKLKVTKRAGQTFLVVKVGHLVRGTLRFKVKAARLSSTGAGVNLTTQVTQSNQK